MNTTYSIHVCYSFTVVSNAIEYRADVAKLTMAKRRPRPVRATNIGPWLPILKVLTWLAVPVNVLVLCYSSKQLAVSSDTTTVGMSTTTTTIGEDGGLVGAMLAADLWLMLSWEHLLLVVALGVSFGISEYTTATLESLARYQYERTVRQQRYDALSGKPHVE
jgi:hypothetical protein